MIPKHGFACLLLLTALSLDCSAHAAIGQAGDTAPGAALDTISTMEVKLFSHPYKSETTGARLNRLEKLVFGDVNKDASDAQRLCDLKNCVTVKAKVAAAPAAASAPAPVNLTNISSYPRVTQLELRLIGESHFGESIFKRIDRLEVSQFGQASTSKDLAGRMDALTAIANNNSDKTRVNVYAGAQSPLANIAMYHARVRATFAPETVVAKREMPNTVVDQIEYLESTAFGKTNPSKTLQKRVDALEQKYYGVAKLDDKALTHRVAQLLVHINNGGAAAPVVAHS